MNGRQRTTRTIALVTWACCCGAGCFLPHAGLGDDDAVDHGDAHDIAVDADVPTPDGPGDVADLPEGTCVEDRDCGDTTCADGSYWCNAGRCERLPPLVCPDDGVRCTRNYCSVTSPTASACVRQSVSSWCPAGWSCDPSAGCVRRDHGCSSDAECDDGVACTEDRCVPGLGICANDPVDADGDGVGDAACLGPGRGGDCDDTNPEVSPNHPEVCANLVDDDCDGLTDYADDDCRVLDNDRCENAVPLVLGVSGLASVGGDLTGYGHEAESSCGGDGPDAFFRVTLAAESRVVLAVEDAGLDTVLTVLDGCGGATEEICNDNRVDDPLAGSRVEHRRLGPGSYVIVVAGQTPADAGPYTLRYAVDAPRPAATCAAPIDATEGGTFVGYLTDGDIRMQPCDTTGTTSVGMQEQFVAHVDAPADLWVDSAGTPFRAALALRAGSCGSMDGRGCMVGDADAGAVLDLPDWTGDAFLSLDYMPGLLDFNGDPGVPYRIEINP